MAIKSELLRSLRNQLHELHEEHDRIGAAIDETIRAIVEIRETPAVCFDDTWTGYTADEDEEGSL